MGFYELFVGLAFVNTFHSLPLNFVDLLKISKFSAFDRVLGDLACLGAGPEGYASA